MATRTNTNSQAKTQAASHTEETNRGPIYGAPKIDAVGKLVNDLEVKSDGLAKARVAIDTTEKNRDSGKYEKTGTMFADMLIIGKQAVADIPNAKKGDEFVVKGGQLKMETYEAKDGSGERTTPVIKVFQVKDGGLEIKPYVPKAKAPEANKAPVADNAAQAGARSQSFRS